MGAIFQDTESIQFGDTGEEHQILPTIPNIRQKTHFIGSPRKKKGSRVRAPHFSHGNTGEKSDNEISLENEVHPLISLIESMKPTFFPPCNNEFLRFVLLTSAENTDPMFLVRTSEVSLLFGTGFSCIERNALEYSTFSDMRIVASEKERIAGWILESVPSDITLFMLILESLSFTPVYSSRTVIAKMRSLLENDPRLKQCRFFELVTESLPERRIRSLSLTHTGEGIHISVGGIGLTISLHGRGDDHKLPRRAYLFVHTSQGFFLRGEPGEQALEPGEVIHMTPHGYERQDLKFVLDTFYRDRKSIGVLAGYTLKDRSELAQGGVVTFVLEEDHSRRAILGHIYIDSRGFVHAHEMIRVHKEIIKGIRSIYERSIKANPLIERPELVGLLRKDVAKLAFLITGRSPVVIPIVQEH